MPHPPRCLRFCFFLFCHRFFFSCCADLLTCVCLKPSSFCCALFYFSCFFPFFSIFCFLFSVLFFFVTGGGGQCHDDLVPLWPFLRRSGPRAHKGKTLSSFFLAACLVYLPLWPFRCRSGPPAHNMNAFVSFYSKRFILCTLFCCR